jgi:hypothetical protein
MGAKVNFEKIPAQRASKICTDGFKEFHRGADCALL